ncbi:MAG: DUF362 domain-containing protein [Eubacterium sp.]|nr:DUF362 domain-containing protein [Eubacterium sp.]
MHNHQIWKIYGTDYQAMTISLLEETGLAQLIGDRNRRIGIKPNLVVPAPAEFGATTHPGIVAGIIAYLQDHGFHNIVVLEGSWVGDRTSEAYEICGYRAVCEQYQVPFIDTQKEKWHSADCAGMKLNITDAVDRIDYLINVPVMKGHCQTKITCALKNLKGILPNKEKSRFHRMGLHKPIAHLQTAVRQDFIVVDHICGDLDFEEGGNPVVRNCIMAALDPVLVDSYACFLMGYTPDDVPYIRMAEALGIGTTDLETAELITVRNNPDGDRTVTEKKGTHLISTGFDPETEEELPRAHKLLEVSYAVDAVDSCSACYANLVGALWRLREEGLIDRIPAPIGIGQGMQGKKGHLGIGKCTSGFDICIMGCPPDEDTIYEKLKELAE